MVSRTTSNASQRPRPRARRAKTSPSLPAESSTRDLETDRKHALIAADIAYERVYGPGVGRRGATNDQAGQSAKGSANTENGPQLGRRQSVRFTGTNAEPTRTRSITRREAPEYRASQKMRRHSLQSESRHINPLDPANDDSFLTALPEEFGENDIASAPSSYRKLRKAKSMFSPGKTPSAVFPNGIPKAGRHFQRHSQQSSGGSTEPIRTPDPRLRRSLSFLRGVTDRISTANNHQYATQDAAIQLARDTYLQQLEQQRLKEQPSFLNLSRQRTSQKAFRRTVRSSSTNSYGTAVGSSTPSVEPTKVSVLSFKARSLSYNLKSKIKRVFRRSRNDENTIPVQQLNATQAHYGDPRLTSNDWKEQRSPIPEPNAEILRRVGSRESIEHSIPFYDDNGPRRGSIRSVHSDEDEGKEASRVSSWTNSTANNTFNMPKTMERKRLSVIKEDGGPHQPSSSARFNVGLRDGYSNFHQPVSQTDIERVKTERVFSALQREIEDNKRRAALDDIESGSESGRDQQRPHHAVATPRRSSSLRRRPPPGPENVARRPEIKPSNSWGAGEILQQIEDGSNYREYQRDYAELREGFTPQEIAEMNESSMPLAKRPLREVKSAFFPPSMHIERSNTSPFRRAMRPSHEDEDGFQAGMDYADQIKTPDPFSSINSRLRNASVAGSESVYSRSPGGHATGAIGSDVSLARSQSSDGVGTAIIITKRPAKYDSPRYSSANSSGDWKKFMASQVASLERHEPPDGDFSNAVPVKESGHKRESAQIEDDDVNIGSMQARNDISKQPLGVILGNANAQPPLHKVGSHSITVGSSSSRGLNKQDENVPMRQPSARSNKTSNTGNENYSPNNAPCHSGGPGKKTRQSSSVPPKSQKWLSTSPSARNSPERAERLRRLKNNSSTSLRKPLSPNDNQVNNNTVLRDYQEEVHGSDDSDASPMTARSQLAGNKQVANNFLRDRRSQMRISEESGPDPAFL